MDPYNNSQYSPLMSKEAVRYITQNITPEEVQYVADVKCVCDDCKEIGCTEQQCDDILYVTKLIAFKEKFQILHWAAENMSMHKAIDEFFEELSEYIDTIAENIQSIIGQFSANNKQFNKIELPISENPLEIINELKICVNNWFQCHTDDIEYEGCRNATSGFIETIHKYVYLFRICKPND